MNDSVSLSLVEDLVSVAEEVGIGMMTAVALVLELELLMIKELDESVNETPVDSGTDGE